MDIDTCKLYFPHYNESNAERLYTLYKYNSIYDTYHPQNLNVLTENFPPHPEYSCNINTYDIMSNEDMRISEKMIYQVLKFVPNDILIFVKRVLQNSGKIYFIFDDDYLEPFRESSSSYLPYLLELRVSRFTQEKVMKTQDLSIISGFKNLDLWCLAQSFKKEYPWT